MITWGDLDARARGLATRLPTADDLERLADTPDEDAFGRSLATLLGARDAVPRPAPERTIADALAARVDLLRMWAGPGRGRALRIVFEDEDRRSVRILLRGAAQGAPHETRLAGLVPTPALPADALEALARERSVERVAGRLAEDGNPYGPPLVARIEAGPFDLFTLEVETTRAFARRALERPGDPAIEAHAREAVDLENAWAAILSGSFAADVDADTVFVEGGRAIDRGRFLEAARIDEVEKSREAVARAFRAAGSPLWRPFADLAIDPTRLEGAVLVERIEARRAAALRDPLSPAPLLAYLLRLRALAVDLRRIVQGRALGAPASVVAAEWASVR